MLFCSQTDLDLEYRNPISFPDKYCPASRQSVWTNIGNNVKQLIAEDSWFTALILTLPIIIDQKGFISWYIPGWINHERMAIHCLHSGCFRLYIPSDLMISLGPRYIPSLGNAFWIFTANFYWFSWQKAKYCDMLLTVGVALHRLMI